MIPQLKQHSHAIAIFNVQHKEDYVNRINYYRRYYNQVELIDWTFNPYTNDPTDTYLMIYVCKDLKYDRETFQTMMKHRIFE